jgi:hypothetical protein
MIKRLFLANSICMILFFTVAINGQDKTLKSKTKPLKQEEPISIIKEGVGIEGIAVGKSTVDDVVKKFGKNYRWLTNKKYSYQMSYERLGLSFYLCQADTRKQIFVIEIKSPYKAKTSKGIVLGESSLEDIEKKYGRSTSGLEYKGVNFYYNRYGKKTIVTEIDVVENTGIRQCKENDDQSKR